MRETSIRVWNARKNPAKWALIMQERVEKIGIREQGGIAWIEGILLASVPTSFIDFRP
jgi:hypothetical protein